MDSARSFSPAQKSGLALLVLAIASIFVFFLFAFPWLLVFAAFFLVLGLLLLFAGKKSELKAFLEEKRKLSDQISNAEKKFLNREMAEEAFKDFSCKKQAELIGVESKIESLKPKGTAVQSQELEKISSRKKHVLKELLLQKEALLSEFKISEQKYLNRELGEKEFFEIQHGIQCRLLELDSEIKGFYSNESVGTEMQSLGEKLKNAEQKGKKKKQTDEEEMASDVSEQLHRHLED